MSADKLTMRELEEERRVLDEFFLETEGEETPEIAELWEQLQGAKEEKVERWGLWILRQQQNAAAIKAEEERLAGRRKSLEASIARSKARLQWELEQRGLENVKRPLCTVRIQNNPPSLQGELTPEQLRDLWVERPAAVRVIPEKLELDRRVLLSQVKEGFGELPAGLEVVRTRSLRLA